MSQSPDVVVAQSLSKKFGETPVVRGISFAIPSGSCFGLLGPNGAGKTSIMRMLGCVSIPSSGHLSVFGLSSTAQARAIKQRLGVVPQDDNLDQYLTAAENLWLYGRYFGMSGDGLQQSVARSLAFVNLREQSDKLVRFLSGGMRRRLLIARALVSNPEILLFDEPTVGLDPNARQELWEVLTNLLRQKLTIVISTHYMDEAEILCNEVLILQQGSIVAQGAPKSLIAQYCTQDVVEIDTQRHTHAQLLQQLQPYTRSYLSFAERLLLFTDQAAAMMQQLTALNHVTVILRRSNLQDVFLISTQPPQTSGDVSLS